MYCKVVQTMSRSIYITFIGDNYYICPTNYKVFKGPMQSKRSTAVYRRPFPLIQILSTFIGEMGNHWNTERQRSSKRSGNESTAPPSSCSQSEGVTVSPFLSDSWLSGTLEDYVYVLKDKKTPYLHNLGTQFVSWTNHTMAEPLLHQSCCSYDPWLRINMTPGIWCCCQMSVWLSKYGAVWGSVIMAGVKSSAFSFSSPHTAGWGHAPHKYCQKRLAERRRLYQI